MISAVEADLIARQIADAGVLCRMVQWDLDELSREFTTAEGRGVVKFKKLHKTLYLQVMPALKVLEFAEQWGFLDLYKVAAHKASSLSISERDWVVHLLAKEWLDLDEWGIDELMLTPRQDLQRVKPYAEMVGVVVGWLV